MRTSFTPSWWLCWSVGLSSLLIACDTEGLKQAAIKAYPTRYEAEANPTGFTAVFTEGDTARRAFPVSLEKVAEGFTSITDLQFPPGREDLMLVLEKTGALKFHRLSDGKTGTLLQLPVLKDSEQGLLGLAFHPRFVENRRFYLNTVVSVNGKDHTRVAEWTFSGTGPLEESTPTGEKVLLEQLQPYANHNAGQLAFGPDGMLYIGFGDGGWRDDPLKAGQDRKTWLGKMLRIDVDKSAPPLAYGIPADNPFVGQKDARPETFALGLRNPWRYSFAPDGRLIVADVGQNSWEEVSIVPKGANMGWSLKEASHCFPPEQTCDSAGLLDPIFEYGRGDGQSITGGYVYTGARVPGLAGKYVFGDFVSGRIWALELPAPGSPARLIPSGEVSALGKWPLLISTFGRDTKGELYVADFGGGKVFRLGPPPAKG